MPSTPRRRCPGPQDVDRAYAAATQAFKSWRWSTPGERQLALLKFADHIEANADELVAVEVQDTGKPTALTLSEEIGPMVDQIRFFAGAARVLEGRSQGEYMRGHTSSIRREPVGVVGQVAPWNYPMMMSIWKIAPALAAGCAVVLKPSDTTPASSVWMGKALQEFYPPGVVNVICGDRDTGAALTSHRAPALVSITGSTGAGIAVATAAAKNVTRAHLEFGGKAPVIVFDDARSRPRSKGSRLAGYFNGGQDCTAATRVIAQAGIYDDFVAALTAKAKEIKTGSPERRRVVRVDQRWLSPGPREQRRRAHLQIADELRQQPEVGAEKADAEQEEQAGQCVHRELRPGDTTPRTWHCNV